MFVRLNSASKDLDNEVTVEEPAVEVGPNDSTIDAKIYRQERGRNSGENDANMIDVKIAAARAAKVSSSENGTMFSSQYAGGAYDVHGRPVLAHGQGSFADSANGGPTGSHGTHGTVNGGGKIKFMMRTASEMEYLRESDYDKELDVSEFSDIGEADMFRVT